MMHQFVRPLERDKKIEELFKTNISQMTKNEGIFGFNVILLQIE